MYACQKGNQIIALKLIDSGADINLINEDGNNALIYAVRYNHPEIVKKLILRGADLEHKNKKGLSPLDVAKKKHFLDLFNIITRTKRNTLYN